MPVAATSQLTAIPPCETTRGRLADRAATSDHLGVTVRTVALAVVLSVAAPMSAAAPASAHGDAVIVERTIELGPGAAQRFGGELHYHRLVAAISSDAEVRVRFQRTSDAAVAVDHPPAREIRLNSLIRCCDEGAWTPYSLIIENPTDRTVRVRADARLVHDDLAVMAYQAEEGTRESVVIIGGIWLALLFTARRSRRPLGRTPLALAALSAGVIAFAAYGAARYGGVVGPGALVAALSDVPVLPTNPIVSRAALLLLLIGIAWSWILARWAGSQAGPSHAVIGATLAVTVAAVALAIAGAYGETGMPLAFTVAALLPIALVVAMRYRTR